MTLEIRLAIVLALAAVVGFHLHADRKRADAIIAAGVQHDLDQAALAPLRAANAAYAQAEAGRAHQAALDQAARDRQAQASQAALAAAQVQADQAQARAALWQDRYAQRSSSCQAALAALESPCADLKDY